MGTRNEKKINENTKRKIEYVFINKSFPFMETLKEIYININDHS